MRPCRKPCRANVADNLSLLDMAADLYAFGIFAQVHIGSRIYGVMFYFQRMASSAHIAFGDDGPRSDTLDFRSDGSRIVYSMMCPIAFQDRMEAGVRETRCDAEEVQRSLQESLPEAVPFKIEIFENAILGEWYGCKIFSLMYQVSRKIPQSACGCQLPFQGSLNVKKPPLKREGDRRRRWRDSLWNLLLDVLGFTEVPLSHLR